MIDQSSSRLSIGRTLFLLGFFRTNSEEGETMFLGLGGSRRRGAQQSIASANVVECKQLQEFGTAQPLENPLQALATGKYAAGRSTSSLSASSTLPCREQLIATSPSSPLSYHLPSLSMSSDSGISLPGSEEAMSRETRGRSQALDLAKKLKSSLGSKFADSLRETIKEVVMKHDSNNAWSLEECEVAKRPWEWAVENHFQVPAHSKRLSWFSQENLSQSAIAELSWGTGATTTRPSTSTMDTEFFSSDLSSFSTGARASWTEPTRRSRHIFPEAAAMGTCSRPEIVALQQSSCSSNNPNSSTKKDQSSFADCESLLDFLTHPREQKLNADSSESWHQHASTSYFGVPFVSQQLPGEPSESKGVKRPREDDAYSSKRQLLHHDDDDGVKYATSVIVGGFEEYLANLAATARVPSYELPVSPLADLLEDLSHDSLVPIHPP